MLGVSDLSAELNRLNKVVGDDKRRLRLVGVDGNYGFSFHEGESLRGGIARALQLAKLPNSWSFLGEFGLKHRNRVSIGEDPEIDLGGIAVALGCDRGEIANRTYQDRGNGARNFFGITVPHGSIEVQRRRFSPSFFACHGAYHLAAWELKFLPFCPVTWDLLEATCDMCKTNPGQAQGWTRTLTPVDRCDECGRELCRQRHDTVPVDMRPALEIVRHLVGTTATDREGVYNHLPRHLQRSSPQEILNVILGLAKHLAIPRTALKNSSLFRLHEACQAVTAWPNGLENEAFCVSGCSPIIPQILNSYASLGAVPAQEVASREYARTSPATVVMQTSASKNCIGLREATAIAGLSADLLKRCWEEGLVSRHYRFHGGKQLPAFDTAELSKFAKAWKDCVGTSTIAHRWSLPNYAIEQLAQLGVLPPSSLTLAESGLRFRSSEVAAFTAKVENRSGEIDGPALTLYALLQNVSGRLKPWGPMFSAIIDGEVQLFVAEGAEAWPKRAFVEASKSQKILRAALEQDTTSALKYSAHITQSDALEILNCSASSIAVLKRLTPQGANPKLYLLDDVLDLAARIMPTAEIAARLDLDHTRTFRILQASRVREIVPGGWARAHASRIIAASDSAHNRQLSLGL